jgi:3-methyladenine DNA glycosylase AlkD
MSGGIMSFAVKFPVMISRDQISSPYRLAKVQKELRALKNSDHAKVLQRFFKTGPGEYAEGDLFLGLRVPQIRALAKQFAHLAVEDTLMLLRSPFHEERLLALLLMIHRYRKGTFSEQRRIYHLYLKNTSHINNWDLVDASAEHIVGPFLENKSKRILDRLARSKNLWERRIAVMATFHFIKHGDFSQTLKIAEILLKDREDLIHKAVGWMLREIGKRNLAEEDTFLRKHYLQMPRTMLRYAIERFSPRRRRQYLSGAIA